MIQNLQLQANCVSTLPGKIKNNPKAADSTFKVSHHSSLLP